MSLLPDPTAAMIEAMSARRLVIVAFDGVQPLDVVGPAEVFHTATRIKPPGYTVEVVAPDATPLRASSVSVAPDRAIASCRGPIDTLICAGGTGVREAARDAALEVARWLVLFLRRPGGQAQFSAQLAAQAAEREPLRELQGWIPDNLDADLSVPALARRVAMSERNFARAFRREVGMTPAAYVETSRVESARIALETGSEPIELLARRTGFGTVETMRRA